MGYCCCVFVPVFLSWIGVSFFVCDAGGDLRGFRGLRFVLHASLFDVLAFTLASALDFLL
ncbi:hypothetical protein PCAR4_750059 [Paraburkholderia caribensis]|nr:hypothetical protein PCAR4_750059 [Paraburkholderia caribensis]